MTGAQPLTGRKVLVIAALIFAAVLTPNLMLAYFAVHTFSGLVVDNGYVASQTFDRDRRAQDALGWTLAFEHADAALRLDLSDAAGRIVRPATIGVVVGRPTSSRTDRSLELLRTPTGYVAEAPLEPGVWMLLVEATEEDGTAYRRRETLRVPDRP